MSQRPSPPNKIFSLRAITRRLKELLVEVEAKQFWVRAQFVPENGFRAGHLYCSLVDNDDTGSTVARMRAVIWKSDRERIENKLRQANQEQLLSEGQEICALCAVRYHAVYGLSLEIRDIDPTSGESLLDKNRREVLSRLQAAGLLDRNKQLPLPAAPLRIGLITSPGSAAYADFTQTLLLSGFSFQVLCVQASMQGGMTQTQVVAAFDLLERQAVDVICLVRGGGSALDLASFDQEAIGVAIAQCSRPVWVGIGHEIDVTVPDFVAHTSHKTPTAVATALVQHVQDLETRLSLSRERLQDICERRLTLATRMLTQNANGLRQGLRKHWELQETSFRGLVARILAAIRQRFTTESSHLDGCQVRLRERAFRLLAGRAQILSQAPSRISRSATAYLTAAAKDLEQHAGRLRQASRLVEQRLASLEELQRYLEAVSPERILARGYSITRGASGTLIRDASQVVAGQTIHTQLAHGKLTSKVTTPTQESPHDRGRIAGDDVRSEGKPAGRDSGASGSIGDANGRVG